MAFHLREHRNWSYFSFLSLHRDVIVTSSFLNGLNRNDDVWVWVKRFLREAKHLDPNNFTAIEKEVRIFYFAKGWQLQVTYNANQENYWIDKLGKPRPFTLCKRIANVLGGSKFSRRLWPSKLFNGGSFYINDHIINYRILLRSCNKNNNVKEDNRTITNSNNNLEQLSNIEKRTFKKVLTYILVIILQYISIVIYDICMFLKIRNIILDALILTVISFGGIGNVIQCLYNEGLSNKNNISNYRFNLNERSQQLQQSQSQ
ncbi:hypothetical protein RhiirA5_419735 [Rhizophagus irregularis]|nr:hypothetical protein RhiirA5_419735 [Rhizophagus irregularis]PKC58298.1 hypothetical protein RhiirA1_471181 [Rhizophagus irregularis]PKY20516.1 hypothetical protein RhiirB3_433821 [Rhizophagus irregularis]